MVQCRSAGRVIVTNQIIFRDIGDSRLHAIHSITPTVRGVIRSVLKGIVTEARQSERNAFLHLYGILDHHGSYRSGVGFSGLVLNHRVTVIRVVVAFRAYDGQSCADSHFRVLYSVSCVGLNGRCGLVAYCPLDCDCHIFIRPRVDA